MSKETSVVRNPTQTAAAALSRSAEDAPVYSPRSDIYEKADALVLLAEMPGVSEKSIEIELEADRLTITGRPEAEQLTGYTLSYGEYRPGTFWRTFRLSDEIDASRIEATIRNGVLRLTLPKKESVKARKIPVKVS
jgi:HSP20 family molecular chaperone IbpA